MTAFPGPTEPGRRTKDRPVPAITAIYVRASSRSQNTASQEPDLKRWVEAQKGTTGEKTGT